MAKFKKFYEPWYIGEKIEDGGYGSVYQAAKRNKEGLYITGYALKKLKNCNPNSIKRFQEEIRLLTTLNHENIIKIDTYSYTERPYFFICPLYKSNLRGQIPLIKNNDSRIKTIFNHIFNGIEYLHSQGLYHRDIKPENILLNSDSELVIIDLGLVRDINKQSTRNTKTGKAIGTSYYMAPEQYQNTQTVDNRADIYSIGKMIYECYGEMLTSPYPDTSKLSKDIKKIYDLCTAHNPDERFPDIHALRQMFNLILDARINGVLDTDIDSILLNIAIVGANNMNVAKVISIFQKNKNQQELANNIIMKFPESVFVSIYQNNRDMAYSIAKIFSDYVIEQKWPFDYTDNIGNKCKALYKLIDDIEIKAKLIYTVLKVGYSHNRYPVFSIFREMLSYSKNNTTEAVEIAKVLTPIKEKVLYANHNLNKNTLHSELLRLFI